MYIVVFFIGFVCGAVREKVFKDIDRGRKK
jgi:hypothetical protein